MLGLFWASKIDFFLRVVLNFKLRVVLKGVWALFWRVLEFRALGVGPVLGLSTILKREGST